MRGAAMAIAAIAVACVGGEARAFDPYLWPITFILDGEPQNGAPEPGSMAVADVDGDGDMDIVIAIRASQHRVVWYENQGGGATLIEREIFAADHIDDPEIVVADFNNDGAMDVFAHVSPSNDALPPIWMYYGDPGAEEPAFTRTDLDMPDGSFILLHLGHAVADLNDDGILDIVVPMFHNNETTLGVLASVGDGPAEYEMVALPAIEEIPDQYRTPHVLDYDGDGLLDIVSANTRLGLVIHRTVPGGGPLAFERSVLPTGLNNAEMVCPGDFDGDGDTDFAVFERYPFEHPDYQVLVFMRGEGWSLARELVTRTPTTQICAADADQDGVDDLFYLRGTTNGPAPHWFKRDGVDDYTIRHTLHPQRHQSIDRMLIADFDGDGWPDALDRSDSGDLLSWRRNALENGPEDLVWCIGDVRRDCVVDFRDLNTVLINFGTTHPTPADANRDGVVGFYDLNTVLVQFGMDCTVRP